MSNSFIVYETSAVGPHGTGNLPPRYLSSRVGVTLWLLLYLTSTCLAPSTLFAQTKLDSNIEKPLRELFVPFEELDVLIGKETNHVYLKRAEYEQLEKAARVRTELNVPLKQVLLEANYRAAIDEGRATMEGILQIEILEEGWHALPLAFNGIGIRSAQLDDAPAALAKNEKGETLLFVNGIGKHRFTLDMVLPVSMDAAQQTIQFQVPTAPMGRLSLSVPGNVEIKSGAVVVSRNVNKEANATEFEILHSATPMSILLSLNNKKLRDQSTVIARGVLVAEITEGYERLHATMSMGVLNGASDEFRFAIDDDLEVSSVTSELLSRWSVETTQGQKQLVVKLRSPATERVVIHARFDRLVTQLADWKLPRMEPLNVAGYSAVVGLLIEDRLSAAAIEPTSLIAIDSSVLTSAMPSSLLAAGSESPQLTAVAAFYAAHSEFSLSSQFRIKPRRLLASANSLVTLSDLGISVAGGFSLIPENEKLFFVDFLCPADWSIDWVRTIDQQELKFDRFPATPEDSGPLNTNATRVRVLLPAGVSAGTQFSMLFHAQRTPEDWLGNWETRSISIPQFPLLNADTQVGAVAVQLQDDLTAVPETTEGLLVMNSDEKARFHLAEVDTALAYRYETQTWQAAVKVSHVVPRMTGQVLSFLQLHPESFVAHTELMVTIDQARSQAVTFSLPESTPTEIAIRGLDGVVVKESSSSIVEGRRFWRVQLAERQIGAVRLAIDFKERLDTNQKQSLQLPLVRAENVDYQSGKIAVEGHSELEVEITEHPRSVDIGELVDAQYQVGKRLLGVFGYVGNLDAVTTNIARIPVHRLPTTIVQRAELVTLVSTQGINQTASRFHLRTNASYLEVRLPADAQLWSVMLDGKPVLPQREQDRVLISLPPNSQSSLRDLQLVYETPSQKLRMSGAVNLVAPKLLERNERMADGMSIPIADLKWEFVLPSGYCVTAVDGNLTTHDSAVGDFSIKWLMNKLWELGGGATQVVPASVFGRQSGAAYTNEKLSAVQAFADDGVEYFTEEALDFSTSAPNSLAPFDSSTSPRAKSSSEDPFGEVQSNEGLQTPSADLFSQAPAVLAPPAPQKPAEVVDEKSKSNGAAPAQLRKVWALDGIRSLAIDINTQSTGERFSMVSFGDEPQTRISVVNQSRLNWLAVTVGAIVFLVGALAVPHHRRSRFLFASALIGCLAPPLTGWDIELEPLTTSVLLALLALLFFFLLSSLWVRIAQRFSIHEAEISKPVAKGLTTTFATLFAVFALSGSAQAQPQADATPGAPGALNAPGQMVASPEQLTQLLSMLGGESGTVKLPADAIVIPFDPLQSADAMQAEKLLVPYQTYVELWNRAHPDKKIDSVELPTSHAWSGAAYTVTLEPDDSLRMTGRLTLEQFTDREIAIPLNLAGCVLEEAKLDGRPPRLQMLEVQPPEAIPSPPAAADDSLANAIPRAMFMLYSQGKGRKQLELTLRWRLDKNNGWRVIEGTVPSSPACKLSVTVPQPKTEVRFGGVIDRTLHETSQPNESIVTVVSSDGRLSLQWRDKITEASVDQGLTIQARSVFDIQEDSLKFAWHGDFEFRRGRRETLTLQLPSDYLVQKVVGNNIRGWTTKVNEMTQQLEVELLKAVAERESFSVFISKQSGIDPLKVTEIAVPQIHVPDAMLQQGHISVRRSLLLELRTNATNGITRMDAPDESNWLAPYEEPGPLALRIYQAYRYSQVPFELKLSASAVKPKISVQYQSLLKVSEREKTIETRLQINPSDRPIYRIQIGAPSGWKLQAPELAGDFQWSLTPDGDRQRLQIYLADGRLTSFPILLHGQVDGVIDASVPIDLPKIEVLDALGQSGEIVVQADPAYEIRSENLQGCESVLLASVNGWLAEKQRESARMVIQFNDLNYSGSLRVSERTPIVGSLSVTNVKVTDRAIEETIFIEANIRGAGIREFAFLLPASMANARIQAPLLRQKNIVPVTDRADVVRVQLLLQNELIGQFRVVVEHDHELTDQPHAAPVPVIETGTTDRRLITLENTSRDELVTKTLEAVERLERSQFQQLFQSDLLVGKSSEAYLVREGVGVPQLTYETTSREVITTAGARIGLAQTLIVVDEAGTYRATQEFRVENRTEPFLEIELPEGASLWTVNVAGESVKPAMAADASATSSRRVRVPLVKTAAGDLDYAVVLKYGGQTPKPGWLRRVEIPLVHTVNISVELSQVRLRLPDSFKWFNFAGTLGRVDNESDLQAGWLSFRTRQLSDLTQLLQSSGSSSSYSKARAFNNLSQLESSLRNDNKLLRSKAGESTVEFEKQLLANSAALETAQQQVAQLDQQRVDIAPGNRDNLNDLYFNQSNGRSLNALVDVGQNFVIGLDSVNDGTIVPSEHFQQDWFSQNKLKAGKSDEAASRRFSKEAKSAGTVQQGLEQNAPALGDAGKKLSMDKFSDANRTDGMDFDVQTERYRRRLQEEVAAVPQSGEARETVDGPAMTPSQATNQPADAYLASLEVELPQRGREYLFSTPRGDIQLSVQGFSQRVYQRLVLALILLTAAGILWLAYRWVMPLTRTVAGARTMVAALTLIGVVSLVTGYLPIYGGIALLAAMVMAFPRRVEVMTLG